VQRDRQRLVLDPRPLADALGGALCERKELCEAGTFLAARFHGRPARFEAVAPDDRHVLGEAEEPLDRGEVAPRHDGDGRHAAQRDDVVEHPRQQRRLVCVLDDR